MIKIRALQQNDDFTDLITLSRHFFEEYDAHHADFFKIAKLKDEDVIRYFTSFCGHVSRKAYIAMDSKRIVGYITAYVKDRADYWWFKRVGEISGFMVQQEYRHQGIGQRLLAEVQAFFAAENLKYYMAYTAVANQAGLDFYQKNGLISLYTTLLGKTRENGEKPSV
jgi:ribosomal protein S18 acetylase RimI-like enzyme